MVNFVRHWVYDLLAVTGASALAIWWSITSDATDLPESADLSLDPGSEYLLSLHVARFLPAATAVLVFFVVLRSDRVAKPDQRKRYVAATAAGPPSLAAMVLLTALLCVVLLFVPGPLEARLGPSFVALAGAWFLRRFVYGRRRVREPTEAGFRPPVHVLLRRADRRLVHALIVARPAEAPEALAATVRHFEARSDARTRAWCIAWAVEAFLASGAFAEAEALLTAEHADADGADPALLAASGLFFTALGDPAADIVLARVVSACAEARRRVPLRLRNRLAGTGGRGRRLWMVWNRQYAPVLRQMLLRSLALGATNVDRAQLLALRTAITAHDLGHPKLHADMAPTQAIEVGIVAAMGLERAGELAERRGLRRDSSLFFSEAAAGYATARYRPGAAVAGVRAALAALSSAPLDRDGENEALNVLLFSLHVLEFDRGLLRETGYRTQLLATREELHTQTFSVLSRHVRNQPQKAAELGAWLMESTHRNEMVDRMRVAGRPDDAAFREIVDLDEVRRRLGSRVALLYRCHSVGGDWRITTAMLSPHGAALQEVTLARAEGTPEEPPPRWTPVSILDTLHTHDAAAVSEVHTETQLWFSAWKQISEAVVPDALAQTLTASVAPGEDPVVLIVPDGPLSAVPFAGMQLSDGTKLAEAATVIFMPNLMLLPDPVKPLAEEDSTGRIVTNLGPTVFTEIFDDLTAAPDVAERLSLRPTHTRAQFVTALAECDSSAIAVIANHGETAAKPADRFILLADDAALSVTDALDLRWPATVVLVACWASDITVTAGADPLGLPTACLVQGARAVIGGQSRVADHPLCAGLLARVVLQIACGDHPALALRSSTVAHLAGSPSDRGAPPAQWANLTVWSSWPPMPAPARISAARTVSWTTHAAGLSSDLDAFVRTDVVRGLIAEDALPGSVSAPARRKRDQGARRSRHGPAASPSLLAILDAAAGSDRDGIVTTGAFLDALAASHDPALRAVLDAGHDVAGNRSGDAAEDEYGGVALDLGRYVATASLAFVRAFEGASALAYELGDREVSTRHVLYGVTHTASNLTSPVSPAEDTDRTISETLFGAIVRRDAVLPPAPPPRNVAELGFLVALPFYVVGLGARWAFGKLGRIVLSIALLGLIAVVAGLHSIGGALPTTTQLAKREPMLTATVIPDGTTRHEPATLLGKLSQFYVEPVVDGIVNHIKDAVRSSLSDGPANLEDVYAFAVLAHPQSTTANVTLVYRGAPHPARLRCPGELADLLCIVTVKLTSDGPGSFEWQSREITAVGPGDGGITRFVAAVYARGVPRSHITVDRASIYAGPSSDQGRHQLSLSIVARGSGGIRPASPVVQDGSSSKLPLLGLALERRADGFVDIYPFQRMHTYLRGVANDIAGPVSGASPYAGIGPRDDPTRGVVIGPSCLGDPGDASGLKSDDVVRTADGRPVLSAAALVDVIKARQPGDQIRLEVLRGKQARVVMLRLGYFWVGAGC